MGEGGCVGLAGCHLTITDFIHPQNMAPTRKEIDNRPRPSLARHSLRSRLQQKLLELGAHPRARRSLARQGVRTRADHTCKPAFIGHTRAGEAVRDDCVELVSEARVALAWRVARGEVVRVADPRRRLERSQDTP